MGLPHRQRRRRRMNETGCLVFRRIGSAAAMARRLARSVRK